MSLTRRPWRERIAERIEAARRGENECWPWPMAIGADGYGRFGWFGFDASLPRSVSVTAHRVVWQFVNGRADPDLVIDHICRNRACVNPAHLRQLDRVVNLLIGEGPQAVNLRKTHCVRGHALEGDNLYLGGKGRSCRACHTLRERERRQRLAKAREPRKLSETCERGHILVDPNVYMYRGYRRCRECRRRRDRERYARDPAVREKIKAGNRRRRGKTG